MREESKRTADYAKEPLYEVAVARANELLAELATDHLPPTQPVVLIAGLPRSGTTLLYQVLAASGGFAYCSNLIARFYERPALGALVQELVAPWLPPERQDFSSKAGATQGWSQPHEFGYFWEANFPFEEDHQPQTATLELSRPAALLGELEMVVERPLLLKNVILSFVLGALAGALPTLRVIRIRRPLLDVARSLANIRREYFGDADTWFSVRPAGTAAVLGEDAPTQIAFQIARVEEALAAARQSLPDRWLEIDYAALCADPRAVASDAADFAGIDQTVLGLERIPESFAPRTRRTGDSEAGDSYEVGHYLKALAAEGLADEGAAS